MFLLVVRFFDETSPCAVEVHLKSTAVDMNLLRSTLCCVLQVEIYKKDGPGESRIVLTTTNTYKRQSPITEKSNICNI